jgi:biopolymer transport protein ExbB
LEPVHSLGFANFLAQTDALGKVVLGVLLAMSLASWYLIVTKGLQTARARRQGARFLAAFWEAPSAEAVAADASLRAADDAYSELVSHGVAAHRHYQSHCAAPGATKLNEAGTCAEFVTRALRRVIDEHTARLERGLTVLASVGATAPFVGLLGTVWGVYHALISIGLSGQGTLDKVAGPVGEALIMTALGLSVAIPAVLGYNAYVRSNRLALAQLDAFAHDLFAILTTGAHAAPVSATAATHAPRGGVGQLSGEPA